MVKILSGAELVGYIQERQARQVRALRQAKKVFPKLVIIKSPSAGPVIDTYVRMKQRYGDDMLVETAVVTHSEAEMPAVIQQYNTDESVHGIIVQLPLASGIDVDAIVNLIAPEKDVDGLGSDAVYVSATAEAINWLLAGYAVDLQGKNIAIVGNGRLVGGPLAKMWQASGHMVTVLDDTSDNVADAVRASDIVVSATGVPRLITNDMISPGTAIVDAGTASEGGALVGDVEAIVRERDDVKITPIKGGVGPLTVAVLYDHVIQAATKTAE